MTLAMSRPWKHPNSGVYWLRKRVPDDLRALVGKREEKRSLNTKDAAEAKARLSQALVELETRWANLRRGPVTLTEVQAHEFAAPVYDQWLRIHKDNPSDRDGPPVADCIEIEGEITIPCAAHGMRIMFARTEGEPHPTMSRDARDYGCDLQGVGDRCPHDNEI